MKNTIILLTLLFANSLLAQKAGILISEFQLSGVLNGERIAWTTQEADISIDKATGEFIAYLAIDDFEMASKPEDFEEGKEKGQYKYLEFSCELPMPQIMENRNEPIDVRTQVTIKYNDRETIGQFTFTILALPKKGFSIMSQGTFEHPDLEVEAIQNLDDELFIVWAIIGT